MPLRTGRVHEGMADGDQLTPTSPTACLARGVACAAQAHDVDASPVCSAQSAHRGNGSAVHSERALGQPLSRLVGSMRTTLRYATSCLVHVSAVRIVRVRA